ncbi:SLAM family member 9-like isoform X2 [Epinephelus moara]|uniref:SLAM family member 9-like isoform X2 n=1 Tax=Epinephelus moara TaxID=300413 RepID=UPI00214EC894|nr:SLAM family member 9-like isoform X2 [Epinephelus moara]
MELIVGLLLLTVSLLPCKAQGSSAVTPVFVKKGEDVLLKIMKADELQKFSFFSWKFNASGILVTLTPKAEPEIYPRYTGRIEFSVENYSVKLKNLQKTDSGVYTAHVVKIPQEVKVAEYNVTVQDPVSPVDLTVDSVSRSSDSCNVTVTCRTQDSHINSTFRCVNQSCSQEGGEQSKVTTSGASLQVYLDLNGSVICNHSNQVSSTEDIKTIEQLCPRHSDLTQSQKGASVTMIAVILILVSILIVIVIVAGVVYHRKRGKYCSYSPNTSSKADA